MESSFVSLYISCAVHEVNPRDDVAQCSIEGNIRVPGFLFHMPSRIAAVVVYPSELQVVARYAK